MLTFLCLQSLLPSTFPSLRSLRGYGKAKSLATAAANVALSQVTNAPISSFRAQAPEQHATIAQADRCVACPP
jgi:hypothetical protein